MKKTKLILITTVAIILGACSGSDTYRGKWKATNKKGGHVDIVFEENSFSITENGKIKEFEYTQNSVNIENSVKTYGIRLVDGRSFQIHFPIGNDESRGAILDANGKPVYIIGKYDYLDYQDVYGL